MSKNFSSALGAVGGVLSCVLLQLNIFAQTTNFTRFDTQTSFIDANPSPTIVSYDGIANGRLPTYEYTFATEGVKIKPNDPNYTETLFVSEWSALLSGKEIAITGKEGMEFNFTTPVNAFGYDFIESTTPLTGYGEPQAESTFVISIYDGTTKLQDYTFTPANNVATFFGASSSQSFNKVVIQETVGNHDDEIYGKLYIKRTTTTTTSTCSEGQYFCLSENTCKPAGQTCTVTTCNDNATCEVGESCNCADCTNGGTDDADKCGLSNGAQMVCTKDVNNSTTAAGFSSVTAQENFNVVNGKLATHLSSPGNLNVAGDASFVATATELKITQYDWKDTADNFILFTSFSQGEAWTKVKELLSIPAGAQVLWSTSSIKYENDSLGDNERYLYSYVIQQTSGVQKQIFFATEFLPGYGWRKIYFVSKDYPLSTTTTGTEVCQNFTNPTLFGKPLALGSPAVGSSGIAPFCLEQGFRGNSTVINSSALTGWLTLWKANGTGWEPNQNGDKIDEIRCCGIPATGGANMCSAQQFSSQSAFVAATGATAGSLSGILENNRYYNYTFTDIGVALDFNVSASAHFGGVYTTTRLPYKIWAMGYESVDLAFSPAVNAFGYDFVEPQNDPGDFSGGWYDSVFTISLYNGATKIKDYTFSPANDTATFFGAVSDQPITRATIRETTGGIDDEYFGKFYVSRSACNSGSSAQVGACCPAGKQWSSAQGACIGGDQCTPIVTLKKGSDLTTVTNSAGEAFSTNGACANKQISLSPCHFTTGAIPDGTSPSGNALYRWPKESSGLSRDYNLVEIRGQCWFADNLQENSSVWPTPVDIWENTTPHNGYGLYTYAGTGVNRPEGYLYQFDAATNNPAPGSAPAGSLQGVCPAGWHVATDCEFQYVEHALGMTVTEQQTVGVRTSGAVGTAMKSGGSSGFDMPLSGARRWNSGGFINGGSEGHLWSSECLSTGCYKRIINGTDGSIRRIQGSGVDNNYDSSHHAAGSVRCVKDGVETPTTCPVAKCAEGQYYCHAELKCKSAGETCQAVVCEDKKVFTYTGAVQDYAVPADVTKIEIKAWGAAGGTGSPLWNFTGAAGGYAEGKLAVNGGEQFKVVVGEGGKKTSTLTTFGGGGAGAPSWGGSGGGLSGIFRNSFTHANSLLIAGGGSGASGGGNNATGFGGGTQGNQSLIDYSSAGFVTGGTQSAGGLSNSPHATLKGAVGGPLSGGNANITICKDGGGGGGGGGYYGGGGGLGDWCNISAPSGDTDGGGGSGYLHASLTNAFFATAVAPNAPAITTYFGGMYGGPAYNNPLTGGQSCPAGYTATQISGTGGLDYYLFVCTRKVSETSAPPTQYAEFGGMWGAGGTLTSGVLAERGINPYTGSGSCPTGFTQHTVLGTGGLDFYMYYCMKSVGSVLPTRDFGGMWGAGSTIPGYYYKNPVTGTASCPAGYTVRTGWGTDNLDWLFQWCYQTSIPSATSASIAPNKTNTDYVSGVAEAKNTGDGAGGNGLVVITECRPKSATTCNNNAVCDTNESCDCSDCNEKVDHCGLSGTGEQMICTKDTAPQCYTDKFPYCLSGCLDGYKMDASGQCVLASTISASLTPASIPNNCTIREAGGTAVTATVECNAGEVRTGGGCTGNGDATFYASMPMVGGQSVLIGINNYTPTRDGWACASGSSATYTTAHAVCCSGGVAGTNTVREATSNNRFSKVECQADEVRLSGGCTNLNNTSIYHYASFPAIAGQGISILGTNYTPVNDGWACESGSTGQNTKVYAICFKPTTGTVAKPSVRAHLASSIVNAGSYAYCSADEVMIGGGCQNTGGSAFHYWDRPFKKNFAIPQNPGVTTTATAEGYMCNSGSSGTVSGAYAICVPASTTTSAVACFTPPVGYTPAATPPALPATAKYQTTSLLSNGTVNDGIAGYVSQPFPCDNCYYAGPKAGQANPIIFKIPSNAGATGSGKYYAFDILNNNYWINMAYLNVDLKIYFDNVVKKSLVSANLNFITWGMRIIPDPQNSGYGWVGSRKPAPNNRMSIILDKDNANFENWEYLKLPNEVKFSYSGTVADYGNGSGGGWMYYYGFIADTGFDASKVSTAALPACQQTTPTTTTTTPQLGACCPPGSAWNSVENRCIPTTCGEGQFYCAAQKKCLAGGTTCETTVCNNDGVCSGEESCQCADCVNGGGDDKDKCSIIGGVQAMCSDDNLTDNKPGACCIPPKKWSTAANAGAGACVECSNTQAPSELKAGVDEPYITCTGNGEIAKTHFRYRITKQGVTETPFTSEIFTIGTQVLHPTMTLGDYVVECFYGNSTGVDASAVATPHSCVKTMSVKSDAQGCSRVYPYKGSTLSDEMTSTFAFDASFRCGSRKPVVGSITNPYMFRIGTQPISYLPFDSLISELFNGLTIGPVSNQTQSYNFNTGTTDVTCATKVGGGYSTNNACRLTACAGGNCNTPQTFSVVHSDDLTCTTEDTSNYNIGCNPAAPDSVRNKCIEWFRDAVTAGSRNVTNGVEFDVTFIFNNTVTPDIKCIKYVAGQMPGGLNLSDNVVCSAKLNNGERYQIYAADTNGRMDALQTTAKTVERDRENPTISEIKYYTDDTLTTEVPTTNWYNKPVVALAVCSDTPLNEATSCACARTVDPTTTDAAFWSVGVPNSLIGADLMRYTRTITESITGTQKVQVIDTAGNKSPQKNLTVSLDTQAPLVTTTETGTGATKTITLTASDLGSKIWKTTTAPSGATNTNGIIYRVGPKADIQTLAFDAECNTTASFATVAETQTVSFPSQAIATVSMNTATQVVAYCVRDNAGNTVRGIYPVITNACFSSTNMATIPTLDTYKNLLKTRLTGAGTDNQKYGYSFSENTTDASCFRGILANNVTTLMANQLKAKTTTTLSNWDTDRSELSTSTTLSNGYYYYVYPTSKTLDIVTSPTASGAPVKSVVVDGGDIRIKTDLVYSGTGKTLLIIARKNTNGQGGNIIIDTNVKRIDAILIADGGALKSSDATLPGERLTINGRLYSYNTRGGSLSVSGADLIDATAPKRFTNASLVNAGSLNDARIQDLERFRPMFADGTNTCSLTINYTAFTTTNLPAILKRPSTFTGGSCGF